MNLKRIRYNLVCVIGGGLAGTSIGFNIAGDIGATIGAAGGVVIGFGMIVWCQMPR